MYLDNIQIGSMAQQQVLTDEKRSIYPNPICPGSMVQIKGPDFDRVILRDMNGKEIKRYSKNEAVFLPNELNAGTYLLQIQSAALISHIPLIVVH